jgi:hypothetical protein
MISILKSKYIPQQGETPNNSRWAVKYTLIADAIPGPMHFNKPLFTYEDFY